MQHVTASQYCNSWHTHTVRDLHHGRPRTRTDDSAHTKTRTLTESKFLMQFLIADWMQHLTESKSWMQIFTESKHWMQMLKATLDHNMKILNANIYREQILNANSWTNTYREQMLNTIPQRWLNATFYREQTLNANLEHNMQILNANRYREFQLSGSGIICKVVLV